MNKSLIIFLLLSQFFGYMSCHISQTSKHPVNRIAVINESSKNRNGEIISLHRNKLKYPRGNKLPLVRGEDTIKISQIVDMDQDGNWDELLFETNVKAQSSDTFTISWVSKENYPHFKKNTNVRLSLNSKSKKPMPEITDTIRYRGFNQSVSDPLYEMEGPGIENDQIAFRAFFDERNGKDIYGKITDKMILQKVGVKNSWHKLQDWGMDILKVRSSLGAGALGVIKNDSLYRLGDADTTYFHEVREGPLEAVFTLDFKGWTVGNHKSNGQEKIAIRKGNFFYKNEVTISDLRDTLISGLAGFAAKKFMYNKYNEEFSSISTYGPQADGSSTLLGLAILFPTKYYAGRDTTNASYRIGNTYYVKLKPHKHTTIYVFACWEKKDKRFSTLAGFEQYLAAVADRLANPLEIKIIQ